VVEIILNSDLLLRSAVKNPVNGAVDRGDGRRCVLIVAGSLHFIKLKHARLPISATTAQKKLVAQTSLKN